MSGKFIGDGSVALASTYHCGCCGQGPVVFSVRLPERTVYVECLECMTAHWDPPALRERFHMVNTTFDMTWATMDDIEQAGLAGDVAYPYEV